MNDELQRYVRHMMLPHFGEEGQRKIRNARVLCIGTGGLGSAAALYLAAAGVGTLGLVDDDVVELTNLPRQLLHGTTDIGRRKIESARDTLLRLNPDVELSIHYTRLGPDNVAQLLQMYDLVVDGCDNLRTRHAINRACVKQGKPYIYGAVSHFEGQASVFAPHLNGPCYACVFPEDPDAELGEPHPQTPILNTVPGVIGCIEATEALKLIVGFGVPLIGRLLVFDALQMRFREIKTAKDAACATCGQIIPQQHTRRSAEAER